jgi:hypothetical protein
MNEQLSRFERRQRMHELNELIRNEQDQAKREELKAERTELWRLDALDQ